MTELVCGIDEAGRGALAAPVFAGAVILPKDFKLDGLTDSKKMSLKLRKYCFDQILSQAICWSIASASAAEIDELNILQATKLAMLRALQKLTIKPDKVIVDGKDVINTDIMCESIIKGDLLHDEISAASVLAKVARDNLMNQLGLEFPQYGFEKHKGYGTKYHIDALRSFGPCKHHRLTFAPVKKYINNYD
jgi:ribonuclease HII